MSRHRYFRTATTGILLGAFLVFVPLAVADDGAESREVTSTFTVTGMT